MKTSSLRNIRSHGDAAQWLLASFASLQGCSAKAASSGWFLLISPKSMNVLMLSAIARLGMIGAVRVLDGGNRFDAYYAARQVQGRSDILDRITVSRAFTCYQVLSLLESTPEDDVPFVVLDMLRTFYDESVQAGERKRLLRDCIAQLDRLGKIACGVSSATHVPQGCSAIAEAEDGGLRLHLLVSVYPPSVLSEEAIRMRAILQESAADFFVVEPSLVSPERQMSF